MLLDFWTVHYARKIANGEGVTEFEDDSFDDSVSALEKLLEGSSDDDWEPVP